jgi:peptidoglycan/LPS O-acetylase OafA/YrhL
MSPSRIPALAIAADAVAVIVFAAVGRVSHAESDSFLGLAGTVAPFAVGLVAAWATPAVRARPAGLRAGAVVLAGTVVIGLLIRAGFTGRLPLSFAIVTVLVLAALMLGWRGISQLVARRARTHVP